MKGMLEYEVVDDVVLTILARSDLFKGLMNNDGQFEKFDSFITIMTEMLVEKAQAYFNEVFGEGVVIVS